MIYLLRHRYKLVPPTHLVKYDGNESQTFLVASGSTLQQVSNRLLRAMDEESFRRFQEYWRPLGYREPETRTSWYIRRGWKHWPLQGLWHLSLLCEWLERNMARVVYSLGLLDIPENSEWSWKNWKLPWQKVTA